MRDKSALSEVPRERDPSKAQFQELRNTLKSNELGGELGLTLRLARELAGCPCVCQFPQFQSWFGELSKDWLCQPLQL